MKICSKCKEEKPFESFSKDKRSKDGFQLSCKKCYSSYYINNKEKIRAKITEWQQANPDRIANYRLSNPEAAIKRAVAWQKANPDRHNAHSRAWAKANPDKRAVNNRARRSLVAGADGSHTAEDIKNIFENQRGLCASCEVKLFKSGKNKYHVDHIQPLSKGGSNWPSNLQCLCPECNMRKGSKSPEEWAIQNGKLL